MRRREFIVALGGTVVASSLVARAQQTAMPVIGFLSGSSLGERRPVLASFRQALRPRDTGDGFMSGRVAGGSLA